MVYFDFIASVYQLCANERTQIRTSSQWLGGVPGGNLKFSKCVVCSTGLKLHQYLIYKELRVVQCAHNQTYICDCQSLSVLTTFSSISAGKSTKHY